MDAYTFTYISMAEPATEVKLFGKWSLEDIEVSDIALAVCLKISYLIANT